MYIFGSGDERRRPCNGLGRAGGGGGMGETEGVGIISKRGTLNLNRTFLNNRLIIRDFITGGGVCVDAVVRFNG